MNDETLKQQLLLRIGEVLYYVWDPIGINDVPEARDEYDAYADSIWRAVLAGKSKDEIAEMLTSITTERMELKPIKEHDDKVAAIVLNWARFLKHPYE